MSYSLTHVLFKRWGTLFLSGFVVAMLSAAASFLFPMEYRADAQLLIISRSRTGVDPYTVVKSAERIGENIAQVVETNDFFQKVTAYQGNTIDKSQFENIPERTKRKRWQKTVDASVVYGTGVLNVSAYSVDPRQALEIAGTAAKALVANASEYVGGDVTIKIVNDAVATRFPARPNLPMNAALGFAAGVVLSGLLVVRKSGPHS